MSGAGPIHFWKRLSLRAKVLVACIILIGMTVWIDVSRGPVCGKDWLVVSAPTFENRTNAGGLRPTVSLVLSNRGPRGLNFEVAWLESRAGDDLIFFTPTNPPSPTIPLARRATAKLTWDLWRNPPPQAAPLACCQVVWQEQESGLRRWTRKLDAPATWLQHVVFDNYQPHPWPPSAWFKPLPSTNIFASTIGVADYFRQMYGWTRAQWLEEAAAARKEAAKAQSAGLRRYGLLPAPSPFRDRARNAFALYMEQINASAGGTQ